MIIKKYAVYLFFILYLVSLGCNKEALEKKPISNILIPTSMADFQGLLDNEDVLGTGTCLNFWSADEFFIAPPNLSDFSESDQHAYTWEKEIFRKEEQVADWNHCYEQVYYCNVVLDGLTRLAETPSNEKWLKA